MRPWYLVTAIIESKLFSVFKHRCVMPKRTWRHPPQLMRLVHFQFRAIELADQQIIHKQFPPGTDVYRTGSIFRDEWFDGSRDDGKQYKAAKCHCVTPVTGKISMFAVSLLWKVSHDRDN